MNGNQIDPGPRAKVPFFRIRGALQAGVISTLALSPFVLSSCSGVVRTDGPVSQVCGPGSSGVCYYVSPSGSDSNPGTLSAPWQTMQKAFDTATGGQTVYFRSGTYPQYTAATTGFNQVENNSGSAG